MDQTWILDLHWMTKLNFWKTTAHLSLVLYTLIRVDTIYRYPKSRKTVSIDLGMRDYTKDVLWSLVGPALHHLAPRESQCQKPLSLHVLL